MTKTRQLNVATGVSFLFLLILLLFWGRSYWVSDTVGHVSPGPDHFVLTIFEIESNAGKISFEKSFLEFSRTEPARSAATRNVPGEGFFWARSRASTAQFTFFNIHSKRLLAESRVELGHWVFALILSVLPALWARQALRHRRSLRSVGS
jgi:hypothetical protein